MNNKYMLENFCIDLKNCVINGRYHQDIYSYSKGRRREAAMNITGSHLFTLGMLNFAAAVKPDIVHLQAVYEQIIRWFLDEYKDIEAARLYLLRGENVLSERKAGEMNGRINKAERLWGNKISGVGIGSAEAFGYMYRLENWIKAVSNDPAAVASPEQHSMHIGEEVRFLAKIKDIPGLFDEEELDTYRLGCFRIYQLLSKHYQAVDMKDKVSEFLQMAVDCSEEHKQSAGRVINGTIRVKEQLDVYTANKKPAYDTDDDEIEEENEGCEDSEDNEDDEAAACPEDDDCRDVMKKVFEMLKKADPEYVDSLIRKMEQQEDEHELED